MLFKWVTLCRQVKYTERDRHLYENIRCIKIKKRQTIKKKKGRTKLIFPLKARVNGKGFFHFLFFFSSLLKCVFISVNVLFDGGTSSRWVGIFVGRIKVGTSNYSVCLSEQALCRCKSNQKIACTPCKTNGLNLASPLPHHTQTHGHTSGAYVIQEKWKGKTQNLNEYGLHDND